MVWGTPPSTTVSIEAMEPGRTFPSACVIGGVYGSRDAHAQIVVRTAMSTEN
jgi:hypothetical protein